MDELRKPNGDYTEAGLKYPGMTANLELCWVFLKELCEIVWAKESYRPRMSMWSIPPRPDNFDMQLAAAFDELAAYRATGYAPERINEIIRTAKEKQY